MRAESALGYNVRKAVARSRGARPIEREVRRCRVVLPSFLASLLIISNLGGRVLALDAIEAAGRYTVKITTAVDFAFGDEKRGTWRGAGFLVDRARGWVLTNAHVAMKSPSKIRISFKDRAYGSAEKFYVDNRLDLAVLRIDPAKIPAEALAANLECEGEPAAGLPVIAFGHPWNLDYTATRGIVSGTKVRDGEEFLQTDAALNPGNSGGALIDAQSGVVVGVNTSRLGPSEGLNFAVPAKLACRILRLLAQGKDPAPPIMPAAFATTSKERELVVADTRDEWSNLLRPGDRILAVDGDETTLFESRFLSHLRGAEKVEVRIRRGDKILSLELVVPKAKDQVR